MLNNLSQILGDNLLKGAGSHRYIYSKAHWDFFLSMKNLVVIFIKSISSLRCTSFLLEVLIISLNVIERTDLGIYQEFSSGPISSSKIAQTQFISLGILFQSATLKIQRPNRSKCFHISDVFLQLIFPYFQKQNKWPNYASICHLISLFMTAFPTFSKTYHITIINFSVKWLFHVLGTLFKSLSYNIPWSAYSCHLTDISSCSLHLIESENSGDW